MIYNISGPQGLLELPKSRDRFREYFAMLRLPWVGFGRPVVRQPECCKSSIMLENLNRIQSVPSSQVRASLLDDLQHLGCQITGSTDDLQQFGCLTTGLPDDLQHQGPLGATWWQV